MIGIINNFLPFLELEKESQIYKSEIISSYNIFNFTKYFEIFPPEEKEFISNHSSKTMVKYGYLVLLNSHKIV